MSLGSRGRRAARGFAVIVIAGLVSAGCQSPLAGGPLAPAAGPAATRSVSPARALPLLPPAPRLLPPDPRDDIPPMPAAPDPSPPLDAAVTRVAASRPVAPDPPPAPEPMPPGPPPATELKVEVEPTVIASIPAADPAPDEVKVPPESTPAAPGDPSPEPPSPAEDWATGLDRLRRLAGEQANQGGEGARPWNLRARLLGWLADPEGPQPPLQAALSALAEADDASPEGLRAAAMALEAGMPLEITELAFCRRVLGFGEYEPAEPDAFRAGQPVVVYCELIGLRPQPDGDRFRSRLASTVEVTPEGADRPTWSQPLGNADDSCRRRRRDYYVSYRILLPPTLSPGPYHLRLTQTDLLAGRSTSRSLPFTIRP
jgi:hypothetical protein